jgi:hypothetical protein
MISSSVIRHISRALAHSATRFAAHFAEGFACEDGGQMLSFAAFPADFLAGEDPGLFAGRPGFRNFRCLS